jgi:hypothetical protein
MKGETMSPSNGQQVLDKPELIGTAATVVTTAQRATAASDDDAGRKPPPSWLETLALIALLAAYGVFLVLGIFVHATKLVHFRDFLLVGWTWADLLILCCLSSVIGELARRLLLGAQQAPQVRAALVRSFFILLALMASHLAILGTPASTSVPEEILCRYDLGADIRMQHFLRMAASASLLSFVVALYPGLIRVLEDRILTKLWGE